MSVSRPARKAVATSMRMAATPMAWRVRRPGREQGEVVEDVFGGLSFLVLPFFASGRLDRFLGVGAVNEVAGWSRPAAVDFGVA